MAFYNFWFNNGDQGGVATMSIEASDGTRNNVCKLETLTTTRIFLSNKNCAIKVWISCGADSDVFKK